MFRKNVIGRIAMVALWLALSCNVTPSAEQQPKAEADPASRRISNFTEHDCNIHQVLSDLADTYEVPIGFEESTAFDDRPTPSVQIDLKSGSIADVLNLVVNADARYEWNTVDGVINVYPKLKQDNILDVVIPKFRADTSSKANLREAITELPQVRARMRELGVRPLQFQFGGTAGAPYARIVLNMNNSSLRVILNEISKQTAEHYWIVNRFGKNHEFLIVNF